MDTLDRETNKTEIGLEIGLFATAAASLGATLFTFPEWPSLITASLFGFNLAGGIGQHYQRMGLRWASANATPRRKTAPGQTRL